MVRAWRLAGWLTRLVALAATLTGTTWPAVALAQSRMHPSQSWPGADLFADGTILTIHLTVRPQDLQQLREDPRAFVHATVTQAGATYLDAALRLKGSIGSFRPVDDKPGFTLDFARFRPGQRFHGLRRFHLNNSVEDPSYCCQQLGSELFRAAGIPAPRVSRAIVSLNQRRLGVYVLEEGFTEGFLSCYFSPLSGNLFEPGQGHDVNQHLKRVSIQGQHRDRGQLHRLAEASLETDAARRWQELEQTLDLDRFLPFMALEVMLGHRDGYCLARNNYRLYQDLPTDKLIFLPQGMDQLFGNAELPWKPHMAGVVARAVIDTPRGEALYGQTFKALFRRLLQPMALTNHLHQMVHPLQAALQPEEFHPIQAATDALAQHIVERCRYLDRELSRPEREWLTFAGEAGLLKGWSKTDEPKAGRMDQSIGPGDKKCLRISTNSSSSASWRTTAWLHPGRYRFEGKVRVEHVEPLGFGIHQGAGLRVEGHSRQASDLVGSSDWQTLSAEFEVPNTPQKVEFICELRAKSGQAWFEIDSLQVVRVR